MIETIEIPAPTAVATASSNELQTEALPSNVSVWLVDDNDGFRSAMADLLKAQDGISCARDFASPDAVLSALASNVGPDVILLDVQMGDRNGLDAIGPIKALSRDTQVLMLTSCYDPEGYNRALAEGASDFLLKSYSPEQIVQRIRNPTRRVHARRNPKPSPICAATRARTPQSYQPDSKMSSRPRSGFSFFRRWLGGVA